MRHHSRIEPRIGAAIGIMDGEGGSFLAAAGAHGGFSVIQQSRVQIVQVGVPPGRGIGLTSRHRRLKIVIQSGSGSDSDSHHSGHPCREDDDDPSPPSPGAEADAAPTHRRKSKKVKKDKTKKKDKKDKKDKKRLKDKKDKKQDKSGPDDQSTEHAICDDGPVPGACGPDLGEHASAPSSGSTSRPPLWRLRATFDLLSIED